MSAAHRGAAPEASPGLAPGVSPDVAAGVRTILEAVVRWRARSVGRLVIAIDGQGAAGKTTLAQAVAGELHAQLLHTDDYFHPATDSGDVSPMGQYYDWRRLREEGIVPALQIGTGDGIGSGNGSGALVAPLLIEGVSAACPALTDLMTHAIYVDTAEARRIERLHTRITPEEWDEEWLAAERVYFATRPPRSFDLIVQGA